MNDAILLMLSSDLLSDVGPQKVFEHLNYA